MKKIPQKLLNNPISTALLVSAALAGSVSGNVLLDHSLADRSGIFVSAPANASVAGNVLSYTQAGSSQRLWMNFAPANDPVTLDATNHTLKITTSFTPKGSVYDTTSRNFRVGVFNDSIQSSVDGANDSGGSGNPWETATGYGTFMPLSSGPASTQQFQLQKRTGGVTSLLGSGSAWTTTSSGGGEISVSVDTLYTLEFTVQYISASQVDITSTLLDGVNVLATQTVSDDGTTFGATGPYLDFTTLAFRFSSATGTADVLDFSQFTVEVIPEPSTYAALVGLLGLGFVLYRRRR